jgi:hypothetical protein
MARGLATFRQSDLERALRAAKAIGGEVLRYEIDKDGKIVVTMGKSNGAEPDERKGTNEWDGT